jgi:Gas vesicle synthesis protein GvpL/GvpF
MAEPGVASYLYCVVPAGQRPSLEGLAGVDPAFGLDVITDAGLSAIVSRVRLEEFGADALKRNLEDLEWLERTARAHNAVLRRALACEAVVPLRLCTIFSDDAHVLAMLDRERDYFLEGLERLRWHAEWSVKVLADPRSLESAARGRSPALAAGAEGEMRGHEFFARKKQDRLLRDEIRAMAGAAAKETHARLQQEAAASVLLRSQHPDVSRRAREMVLNGAYLVERSRVPAFQAATRDLAERHRAINLELEVTGPWAPYNFVSARTEAK